MVPFIVAKLCIKCSLLEPLELDGELGPDLLEAGALPVLLEHIPVAAEKDIVALVVPRDHLTPRELRLVREEVAEEPPYRVAEARVKVIDDELGVVVARLGMALQRNRHVSNAQ